MEIKEGTLVFIKNRAGFGIVTEKKGGSFLIKVAGADREFLFSKECLIPLAQKCSDYTIEEAVLNNLPEILARMFSISENKIQALTDIISKLKSK